MQKKETLQPYILYKVATVTNNFYQFLLYKDHNIVRLVE